MDLAAGGRRCFTAGRNRPRAKACQYRRFVELFGRKPTHLDSHHHVHMFPQIFPIVAAFAGEEGIALRIDRQPALTLGFTSRRRAQQRTASAASFTAKRLRGTVSADAGCLQPSRERSLKSCAIRRLSIIRFARVPTVIPTVNELDVLTSASLKYAIADRGYRLGSYLDV